MNWLWVWSLTEGHVPKLQGRLSVPVILMLASVSTALGDETLGLSISEPIGVGVASLPRVKGDTPEIAAINAQLDMLDDAVRKRLAEVLSGPCSFYEREVSIAYYGPHFLSLADVDSGYCDGAAHPWYDVNYLTYDVKLGAAVDWATLVPAVYGNPDHANVSLTDLYISTYGDELRRDCAAVLTEEQGNERLSFALWFDAGRHALGISPLGLAYAFTSCENPAYIPVGQLQSLGFDAEVIAALANTTP